MSKTENVLMLIEVPEDKANTVRAYLVLHGSKILEEINKKEK